MIAETKTRLFKDNLFPSRPWCLTCWCMAPLHFNSWALAHRLLINHRHAKRAAGRTYTCRRTA